MYATQMISLNRAIDTLCDIYHAVKHDEFIHWEQIDLKYPNTTSLLEAFASENTDMNIGDMKRGVQIIVEPLTDINAFAVISFVFKHGKMQIIKATNVGGTNPVTIRVHSDDASDGIDMLPCIGTSRMRMFCDDVPPVKCHWTFALRPLTLNIPEPPEAEKCNGKRPAFLYGNKYIPIIDNEPRTVQQTTNQLPS